MTAARWPGLRRRTREDGAAGFDAAPVEDDPVLDELVAALTADPSSHELDGLERPLAAYRRTVGGRQTLGHGARRPSVLTGLLTTRAAAAAAGVAAGLAATAVVLALGLSPTGTAPSSVTPAATPSGTPTTVGQRTGPDATGPAAHGLCRAWANHREGGDAAALDTPPMRNLAEAAGGAGRIEAYCAAVPHPGQGKGRGQEKDDKDAKHDKDRKDDKDHEDGRTPGPRTTPPGTPSPKPSKPVTPSPSASPTTSPSASPSPSPSPSP